MANVFCFLLALLGTFLLLIMIVFILGVITIIIIFIGAFVEEAFSKEDGPFARLYSILKD